MPDSLLVIRNEQMKVFTDENERRWVIKCLQADYPEDTSAMGAPALGRLVERAQAKAHAHGFRDPQEVRKYTRVAFLLGADFESDPQLGWARQILTSRRFKLPLSRLRALEDATLRHLSKGMIKRR